MYTLRQLDRFEITAKHLVVFNFKSLRDGTYEIWVLQIVALRAVTPCSLARWLPLLQETCFHVQGRKLAILRAVIAPSPH
jgi:hypothetical protein